jgi:hypothetical protein
MKGLVHTSILLLPSHLMAVGGLLLLGLAIVAGCQDRSAPIIAPYAGAPVTVSVDGERLVISNNTADTIYFRSFPTEILPVIEWAPCIAPEVCPVEQRIGSGEVKEIALKTIVREGTESITVYWWHYLERRPGASVPPMEMAEIKIALP